MMDLKQYYERQIKWSCETFGPNLRTKGVIQHISKELKEVEANPHDLSEWADIIILAMDGFWRHGGKADDLLPTLIAKQKKNIARVWPDWRTMSEDSAIENDRSGEAIRTSAKSIKAWADSLSMRDLARRVGTSPTTIFRYRRGQEMDMPTARKLLPYMDLCPCCNLPVTITIDEVA
jgi:Protein of unknown function (DUF550)